VHHTCRWPTGCLRCRTNSPCIDHDQASLHPSGIRCADYGYHHQAPVRVSLRISHKVLPKDLWAIFDTREAAEQYGRQLEGLLAQGIVPAALLERDQPRQEIWTVQRCIAEYLRHNPVPLS
jgi:hypothetical protein